MRNDSLTTRKRQLRATVRSRRNQQLDQAGQSRLIAEQCLSLREFSQAQSVAIYLATSSEVETQFLIEECWRRRKLVAVPCCFGKELRLFRLESMLDLAPRTMGILEPRKELHSLEHRWLAVSQIDLFLVPGIAFDRRGRRLGYGKGYYDRLLVRARQNSAKVGLAFECQLTDEIPVNSQDIAMDIVVTNESVYRCETGCR